MSCNDKARWPVPSAEPEIYDDDAWCGVPQAEALIAGTLALMTGVLERAALTQPLAGHGQSLMMAAKVRTHLLCLSGHPQVSAGFRVTMERLCVHWDRLASGASGTSAGESPDWAASDRQLWHRAPDGVH